MREHVHASRIERADLFRWIELSGHRGRDDGHECRGGVLGMRVYSTDHYWCDFLQFVHRFFKRSPRPDVLAGPTDPGVESQPHYWVDIQWRVRLFRHL